MVIDVPYQIVAAPQPAAVVRRVQEAAFVPADAGKPDTLFGPAVIREPRREAKGGAPLYGPDALLRSASGQTVRSSALDASSEEEAAEARTIRKLEQRDQTVRQREQSRGEAVNGEHFLYQTGPDGKRYAIGASSHVVREDGAGGFGSSSGARTDAELSDADKELIQRLQARDLKVRGHENAHIIAGGSQIRGAATYEYQTGPDGRRYAVGGSVNIAVTSVPGDPEATARRAQRAQRAALAAGDPSIRDMLAAGKAANIASRADDGLAPWERERAFAAYAAAQGL